MERMAAAGGGRTFGLYPAFIFVAEVHLMNLHRRTREKESGRMSKMADDLQHFGLNNLERLTKNVKRILHAMKGYSEYVTMCTTRLAACEAWFAFINKDTAKGLLHIQRALAYANKFDMRYEQYRATSLQLRFHFDEATKHDHDLQEKFINTAVSLDEIGANADLLLLIDVANEYDLRHDVRLDKVFSKSAKTHESNITEGQRRGNSWNFNDRSVGSAGNAKIRERIDSRFLSQREKKIAKRRRSIERAAFLPTPPRGAPSVGSQVNKIQELRHSLYTTKKQGKDIVAASNSDHTEIKSNVAQSEISFKSKQSTSTAAAVQNTGGRRASKDALFNTMAGNMSLFEEMGINRLGSVKQGMENILNETVVVGRLEEKRLLTRSAMQLHENNLSSVYIIEGETGIGKTSLIYHLGQYSEQVR